ncbi:virion morphogenesis protein, partial [Pseudomonas tremae]|nr:virion morphogenesis protein [Pseudomonas tremae]MCF5811679.1 virion morphogenesis protein [Pseudomonas tremae]
LPARQFLGASDSETSQLVNLVLQQILNSPR